MREAARRINIQPRGTLVRGADGQLKRASTERDVADIWAEQKRIQLREAIEEAERKARRAQWRKDLFKKKPAGAPTVKTARSADAKAIEISLRLPKIQLPRADWAQHRSRLKKLPRTVWVIAGVVFMLAFGVYLIPLFTGGAHQHTADRKASSAVSGATTTLPKGTPDYATVLPAGKDIASLGGWSRVSPPDRDPVYAYEDTLDRIHITVTEQPLPANFAANTDQQVAKLAQQSFNATQQLTISGISAYLATSVQGPQSLIFADQNLLVLIKSASQLTPTQWTTYLSSLQFAKS